MNSKIGKNFMALSLGFFVAISSMALIALQQSRASGRVPVMFQTAGLKANTIVAPKAGWLDNIVNQLLKFIKKR